MKNLIKVLSSVSVLKQTMKILKHTARQKRRKTMTLSIKMINTVGVKKEMRRKLMVVKSKCKSQQLRRRRMRVRLMK